MDQVPSSGIAAHSSSFRASRATWTLKYWIGVRATKPPAYGFVVGGRFTFRRCGAPVCDLDAVEVVRRDRRVPNAIPFDGLKIDKPVVAEIGRYRAFSAG
jgi:hypothetical protein